MATRSRKPAESSFLDDLKTELANVTGSSPDTVNNIVLALSSQQSPVYASLATKWEYDVEAIPDAIARVTTKATPRRSRPPTSFPSQQRPTSRAPSARSHRSSSSTASSRMAVKSLFQKLKALYTNTLVATPNARWLKRGPDQPIVPANTIFDVDNKILIQSPEQYLTSCRFIVPEYYDYSEFHQNRSGSLGPFWAQTRFTDTLQRLRGSAARVDNVAIGSFQGYAVPIFRAEGEWWFDVLVYKALSSETFSCKPIVVEYNRSRYLVCPYGGERHTTYSANIPIYRVDKPSRSPVIPPDDIRVAGIYSLFEDYNFGECLMDVRELSGVLDRTRYENYVSAIGNRSGKADRDTRDYGVLYFHLFAECLQRAQNPVTRNLIATYMKIGKAEAGNTGPIGSFTKRFDDEIGGEMPLRAFKTFGYVGCNVLIFLLYKLYHNIPVPTGRGEEIIDANAIVDDFIRNLNTSTNHQPMAILEKIFNQKSFAPLFPFPSAGTSYRTESLPIFAMPSINTQWARYEDMRMEGIKSTRPVSACAEVSYANRVVS